MIDALKFHRIAHKIHLKKIPIIPKVLEILIFLMYNSYIPSSAKIGKSSRLGYGGIGVVIHAKAIIGEGVIIGSNVTIGGKSGIPNVPQIGNNVYLATGCKILGDVKIGKNAIVGANSVVLKDVPDNCVVAGVPAKIIKYNEEK